MRVGINTGPVLLGAVGSTAEFTAMGDAVNVASRLEHVCPRDGVLISHHTYRHVRGVFDVETMPPLTVKGKAELLTLYLVRAVKTRAFRRPSRGVEGVETRMIGRDAELARLCAAFDIVADAPTARVVTIVGDAGVGKSRLLWEFDNWIELHPRAIFYLKGRAVQQRDGTPLALIHDLVATRFEIADSDSSELVLAKLVEGAAAALRPNEAMTLGAWLGFDLGASVPSIEGDALAVAARTYFVELLRGLAREAPVVMLLEDVHWADDESLDLVERLTGFIGALPVLVVAAARPSLYERRAAWGDTADCETIRLDALGAAATRLLVAEILRLADDVPDELVELILDRSDGNAFYVEELVKMFIDDGVIDTSSQAPQWNVDTTRVDAARVPATLTGVLQARLDALPSRARTSLQHASVVGRVFWDSAVDALSDGHHDLASLHQRELVFPRHPSAFSSASEYIFKHALLRDVVYESVLLSERPVLHKRTAEWLEQIAGDRRDEYLVEIATHRRAAGQTAAAAEMLVAAAKLAARAGALRSASALAEQAIELWESDGVEPPAGALVVLAGARRALGRYADSRVVAQRALVAARAMGDTDAELSAAHIAARIAEELGDNGEASDVLAASLPTAERSGGAALAEMLGHFALTDLRSRRSGDALALAQRGLEIAHASGHLDTIASVTRRLTSIAYELGDVDLAATYAEAAVAASRGTGDLEGEAMALSNFGAARYVQGEVRDDPKYFLDSKRQYEAAVDIGRRLGSPELIATVLANLAEVTVRLGDPAGAAGLAHEGMGLAFGVGAIPATLIALVAHAEALIAMGDRATGLALLGLADRQGFVIGSTEVGAHRRPVAPSRR